MRRRAYLAATGAALVGGCVGRRTPDRTPTNDTGEDPRAGAAPPAGRGIDPESDDGTDDGAKPEIPGTIDDFEDLSRWSVVEGALSADRDRSLVGDQSGRIDVPADETSATIVREFSDPIDLSSTVPGVGISASETVVPWLQAVDAGGDRVDFRRGVGGGLPMMRKNVGVSEVVGDPDLSEVAEIRIALWIGRDVDVSVWFDDLHAVPRPETGKLMIQFDDTYGTDYTEARPRLERHDVPAVSFVNPGYVGGKTVNGHPRLTEEQLYGLRDAGWTVANHTESHVNLPELSRAEQEAEIRGGKEWLEERGFERGARFFAYPFGSYDATTVELVSKHHDLAYAGGYPVQGYTSAPYLASRIEEPSAKRAKDVLDLTAEMRGITSILYHRLEGDLLEDFEAMVEHAGDLIAEGDLEVVLPGDVEREYLY